MKVLSKQFKELKLIEADLSTYDFDNVFEEQKTTAGLDRTVIDQLEEEKKEIGSYAEKYGGAGGIDVEALSDINTPIYTLSRKQLVQLCTDIFESHGLISFLEVDRETVSKFFTKISQRYKKVPYHNFTHACWLVKLLHWVTTRVRVTDFFSPIDLVGMFVAGVAHDMDHSGMNNSFMTRTRDPLSFVFNDKSVLENYHASLLFQLMNNDPEIDIFKNLPMADQKYLRSLIIQSILATDMSVHFQLEKDFKDFVTDTLSRAEGKGFRKDSEEARIELISVLLHTCDISSTSVMVKEHS